MHVGRLEVVDFRNYEHAVVQFQPGVTTLLGGNGQGKTNLVEAIGYAATLGSHRVATDGPLVRRGAQSAVIRAEAVHEERRVRVDLEILPGRANRVRVNSAPVARPRDCLGVVRRVLFAPEDLALVKGDPSGRRLFLDDLLVSLTPRYSALRADLDRVLRQRNSLLKSAATVRGGGVASRRAAQVTLSVWDEQFVALAAELIVARMQLVARLGEPVGRSYCSVAPQADSGDVSLAYICSIPGIGAPSSPDTTPTLGEVADGLTAALARVVDDEFARGMTLVGPHRDDLELSLHGMPVRGYASHGESWSMALALRLASYDIAVADGRPGGAPILILDDVFAELDADRRERLAELVAPAEQVIVTAAASADVPSRLRGEVVEISKGRAVSPDAHQAVTNDTLSTADPQQADSAS